MVGERKTCPRMWGSLSVGVQAQVGQAVEQQVERGAHFESGQVHAPGRRVVRGPRPRFPGVGH